MKHHKRLIFGLGSIVFVLLIAGFVFYRIDIVKSEPQLSQQALINQINNYNGQRKYDQAIKLIKGQRGYDNSSADQSILASTYINQGNYNQALSIYYALNKMGKMNEPLAESAAAVAQQAHNNKLAIAYYNQAIKLAKVSRTTPVAGANAAYDAQQIQNLEKQN
jgi:tetratricopeptide (TPR) repeat protein